MRQTNECLNPSASEISLCKRPGVRLVGFTVADSSLAKTAFLHLELLAYFATGIFFFVIRQFSPFPYYGHSEAYHASGSEKRKRTRIREERRTTSEIFITFRERTSEVGK